MTARRLVETRPTGVGRARGLVSDRVSGRRIESQTFAPCAALADVVACHWVGRWDLPKDAPHHTELLGDPCVHIVFEQTADRLESRVVGVWTRLWRRTLEGKGLVRGVKVRAGAARAFLPSDAIDYACRLTPLDVAMKLSRKVTTRLERAVLGAVDDGEAFALLEAWLTSLRILDADGHTSFAVALVDRIGKDSDLTTMERLSEVSGLGPRALQRIFREHVGASPKWVIRRNRLQEVALRIERGDARSLADLAAELGYTDQAHLARDFKSATGKAPSAFRSEAKR